MSHRTIASTLLFFFLTSMLSGCTEIIQPEQQAQEQAKRAPSVTPVNPVNPIDPQPYLKDQIFFQWDEKISAITTLTTFPNVVEWRLKMDSRLKFSDFVSDDVQRWNTRANVWGYDLDGNEIASGNVTINWDNWRTSGSTVVVEGVALNIEQSGQLFEAIVNDALTAGPGKSLKASCWWLAGWAALELAGLIALTGLAATACAVSGPGMVACVAALIAQAGIGRAMLEDTLAFLCQCIDGYAELNPELCDW